MFFMHIIYDYVSEDYSIVLTVFILHDHALHSRVYYFICTTTVPRSCAPLVHVGSKDFVGA